MRELVLSFIENIKNSQKTIQIDEDDINFDTIVDIMGYISLLNKAKRFFTSKYEYKLLLRLELLFYIVDEFGFRQANEFVKDKTTPWKNEAKIRLFMMFTRRFSEINYLIKGGYSSAALSIIRGLYEIAVYFDIIKQNDDALAERFLKYANTERLKISRNLTSQLNNKVFRQVRSLGFGKGFIEEYGWAKSLLPNNEKISFYDLVELTGLSDLYHLYTYSSGAVHASILDSLYGIGVSKQEAGKSIWITTPSKHGITTIILMLTLLSKRIIDNYLPEDEASWLSVLLYELQRNMKKNGTAQRRGRAAGNGSDH